MPKRTDLQSILIIGAGPIVIGQACEFDYSGAQACKALREEGFRVILVNSNPATIMTDPAMADATYIEPITWETVAKIIEKERPDALLPTMGGQTALNCALDLERHGVLAQFNVEMIGANADTIDKAENRDRFDKAMRNIGLECPKAKVARTMPEAWEIQAELGFPTIIRPSFTMGGSGGGVAYNKEEFEEICGRGFELSPTHELLIDESLLGWKEYEMEVVRDKNDNCIIVCAIENFDPMGVHTGDSITVAPAQTLTDKEYQMMRDASLAVLREIGVETGGSNVQFGMCPDTGRMVVIEMNPRVSRSSALASKATGFPIAKVAAKLAVGYTLDELQNEITGGATPASFEPSIDYVVTKIPRFNFEKFAAADPVLTTQMKSVGEVMAIGRNLQESLHKALRGLETDSVGFDPKVDLDAPDAREVIARQLSTPGPERIWIVGDAFRAGMTVDEVFQISQIDRWFLVQIEDLINDEKAVAAGTFSDLSKARLYALKRKGFSDARLAQLLGVKEQDVRSQRRELGVQPVFKRVDTCAAEFSTATAYMYSSYDEECEANVSDRDKIMVIGGGPNRIGQGIEFDYCCVHAAFAMKDDGYETIMVNCNPETVSTDYDTSDRLYFEPVTLEDVLAIVDKEKPKGVIVQYGGQTPLKLARDLQAFGVPIIGTSPDAIDEAEDRERFQQMVNKLGLKQPPNRTARSLDEGLRLAAEIGYPLVVRPSYVLGGRAMEIVYNEAELRSYMNNAVSVSNDSPVLLDRFLDDAIEVDVDAVCDGKQVVIGGIMQHIEQAGVHSGDSACSLPPYSLDAAVQDVMREQAGAMALELGVIGLMNVQFAVKGDEVYVLEVNPRASRTVPYVSKCIGVSLAKVAARCMAGVSLAEQGFTEEVAPRHYFVKEAVFPFAKFPKVDPILGPEMKSTGEVMGVGATFAEAFGKASLGAGERLPKGGTAFISVRDADKAAAVDVAKSLIGHGFELVATRGTAAHLAEAGLTVKPVNKVLEGRPHIVDMIKNDGVDLIVNTTEGKQAIRDSFAIRRSALQHKVFYTTTITAAYAVCQAMAISGEPQVRRLQDLHADMH
ncbi:carbamoyl-phosphate synthase large subunit [Alloalcanivorax profundimaris]|uniref:carbamoyl-phosphate synthase large subunit n=1 Tax=Alloalcanivorax profundimaris TaxID=2735259 RepID=UPI000C38DEBD|nr:carbamoyl-phosphate synthase large subunit [Alloalcanivorax profundimaris]MAO60370.1 carbamoyl phosphate synthase large subunit [Alcanivorax sp.]UWN49378.1 Carbamoyl-phosphate synthase large chain [Alcanivorax sp. ALC70]MBF1802009.1 carbamoyl-phosphate synthase large subunit [Alloalcanivorax profundimaris]MBT75945.1 carbamoyl phosphate synthase large subunit [Alcanivorax sp.]HCE40067.1 carbamoyl phosphate synthase large subunit [Alcanivorax sp.]|tara:strand:- start:42562 stop:45780 length:3219 start_codon:yes stop_codon:yes gene_type:complete